MCPITALTALTLSSLMGPGCYQALTKFSVGIGTSIAPEYEGAIARARPLLAADYDNGHGFFASTTRGLGFQTQRGAWTGSAAVGYDFGRGHKSHPLRSGNASLAGMGDIPGSVMAMLGTSVEVGAGLALNLSTSQALTHRAHGATYDAGFSLGLKKSARNQVIAFGSATWSDGDHAQTFFGVTPAQNSNTRYAAYTPRAGLSKIGFGVNWRRIFQNNWTHSTTFGAIHYLGDAGRSPLTEFRTVPLLVSTVSYSFN